MPAEIPRQRNMFTDEWDDNRTRHQKQLDRHRQQPKQMEMFSQRDIAQFGVKARPLLPISPNTKLGLIFEDPRTEEQIESDIQREAERRTHQMFDGGPGTTLGAELTEGDGPGPTPESSPGVDPA
jgi:hypothetical protein